MTAASFFRLVCLAAIWGASFLFMRIAAHSFGPAYLIEFRVLFAAISLLLVSLFLRRRLVLFKYPKHFLIIASFNTAMPFMLFAYAAQTLNASTLSILNSTAVIWGAVIAYFWHRTPLSMKGALGLVLGVIGVAVLVGWDAVKIGEGATLPIIAGVMAASCYGIATNYAKNAPKISSFDNAHGSMWGAVILVLPLLPWLPMPQTPTTVEWSSVVVLGVLCTGLAYLLYFRLVDDIGPASTLSVTFLIPFFGILWGNLVLDEPIGFNTMVGTLLVVTGTMLVTGFSPKNVLRRKVV
ncbi:putative Permease of the drug/metabolite transporter (DMT) superfamily [Vibrio nigripulchritudo SFn27]|uniref:Putative Permease of the drug/metabolite transporter (DMT) superfamily n=1 Tax=Vibrio nigripulchritudo TaxID=28173 RepID=U4KHU7_9VIBR|nr:DMT family transporter [Vibrio nigripulchritudo]KJY78710.1 membrane protein [Vibrio nigripulchritudo]CCN81392.1 putative Permease of the drug/metabolite transporter (DMT) superfamily [Vibrio nigripulchritudo BLFn1]CCN91247.1 putative Permease of the drug/metabolite transporter (DMT) superfamily [Vibrio nigripulchritudo SFn27]CCN96346.1 putative Permease of the drug/metabolite transporter (DMT) superfamily [Vibrio nigripulchritudo ENn2]CCO38562.1 putative Permease of the drug/metabolite tran